MVVEPGGEGAGAEEEEEGEGGGVVTDEEQGQGVVSLGSRSERNGSEERSEIGNGSSGGPVSIGGGDGREEEAGDDGGSESDEDEVRDSSSSSSSRGPTLFGLTLPLGPLARGRHRRTESAPAPSPADLLDVPGEWRSGAGPAQRVRFASQRSDVRDGEVRGIVATPLDAERARPMPPGERFLRNVEAEATHTTQLLRLGSFAPGGGGGGDGDEERGRRPSAEGEDRPDQMYRLQATSTRADVSRCGRIFRLICACVNCGAHTESSVDQWGLGIGDPNTWLTHFFFWLFRKGWSTVVIFSVVSYYFLVLVFAFLIMAASMMDNDCVKVGGDNIGTMDNRSKLMDSFSLSWNTFSTVGYGSTYPALSTEGQTGGMDHRCAFINFLTSMEAFVGILFAGFVGAVFFAKVSRIIQRADVRFSEPLTVRFGSGVDVNVLDDDHDAPQDVDASSKENSSPLEKFRKLAQKVSKPSPFPVITFRIANERHDTPGGEIVNATVKAVVIMESAKYDDQVSKNLANLISKDRNMRASTQRKKQHSKDNVPRLRKTASMRSAMGRGSVETISESSTISSEGLVFSGSLCDTTARTAEPSIDGTQNAISMLQSLNVLATKARHGVKKMKIDEEEYCSSKIVPKIFFTTLKLETSEHPMFKRIWRFKHIINKDSPLLTPEAQKVIAGNRGNWPWQWNNHESVRKAIRFNQMVVSFAGISNISGAPVYKQKVYDFADIAVGYQFANALHRGRQGLLQVDLGLINDVIEQNGGGGEPLNVIGKAPEKDDISATSS